MKNDSGSQQLNLHLKAYAATVQTPAIANVLKRSAERWSIYAAVTSAALAMASNASASIIYSGIINVTAAAPTPGLNHYTVATAGVPLKNASGGLLSPSFFFDEINLRAHSSGNDTKGVKHYVQVGLAFIGAPNVRFLAHSGAVRQFSLGAVISGVGNTATVARKNGFVTGTLPLAARASYRTAAAGTGTVQGGWPRTEGFAAFSFNPGSGTDYGWVRLRFTVGNDDGVNSLTAIEWAYQNDGSAILTGDTGIPGAPEPSTAALMVLAAGAAGVGALRKRRKTASHSAA